MIKKLLFLDVEATGVEEEDRLIQVAFAYQGNCGIPEQFDEYIKPPLPIKKAAMAIHHITEKDVADKKAFWASESKKMLDEMRADHVLVAHNAQYDLGMLAKENMFFPDHICTLKVAKHLDDGQFENHQLQYLRYYYDLDVELGELAPHDALADVLVLQKVAWKLSKELEEKEKISPADVVDRMIEISKNPLLLKICGMKKHKGKTWEQVAREDRQYLQWNLTRDDLGEDERHTINYWLKELYNV